MTRIRISASPLGGVLAGTLAAALLAGCGTPRLASRPQPDADLSGRWMLESGDDAAKLITAALPAPRKPRAERDPVDPDLTRMPRDGTGQRRGSRGSRGDDQSQAQPAQRADPTPAWGRLTPRDFVAAFVMPPTRLDVVQQSALMRVGAGDRPRAFEPGDEEPVTVSDRYGSRTVRAGWVADAFVITSEDRNRLHLIEQFKRNRDGRLERTVEFSAPQVKTLHVRSVYRLAAPSELDRGQTDGPPLPPAR